MPRPPTAHRHPHSNARQFDLFCDPPYAAAQTPQWQALPAETRHTLTRLMVRLIFGYADDDLAREAARHEINILAAVDRTDARICRDRAAAIGTPRTTIYDKVL